ncbi:hypothetical protein LTR35_016545 [Friedmanniomyces endolithicus]|nr:hypothetical protein LTR35_016545 [Friedmanniomyces endolithicus]KAK0273817.1 hypothetical protein LTS00_015667 [Friedmanniomyces endolithicus]KAK0978028.1 hypothetical protein LTR54_016053 [Friedmanniomyces endolithicus]
MSAPTSHDASVAPMTLEDLPEELIELCLEKLDKGSLQNLRLVNRFFTSRASKVLYWGVTVYCSEHSAQNARLLLDRDHLNPLIKSLALHTYDPDLLPDRFESRGGELPEEFETFLGDVGRFRGLRAVQLEYLEDCAVERLPTDDAANPIPELQSVEFRSRVLTALVQGLNHEEHPATKVHDLKIDCLQDVVDTTLARSDDFRAVVARLDLLSLHIISESETHPDRITPSLYLPEPYHFFGNDLRQYWLEPVRENLTHLSLNHEDRYWGYLPYCNLPGLHFPKLQSLRLIRMVFTHDWQVDWLTSHGSTLTSLILIDYRYPDLEPCQKAKEDVPLQYSSQWRYGKRWHDYAPRLNAGLPHLERLGIYHPTFDAFQGCESEFRPPPVRYAERYLGFDQFTSPCWMRPGPTFHGEVGDPAGRMVLRYDNKREELEEYPDCLDKDSEAIEELMESVRGRRETLERLGACAKVVFATGIV